MDPSERKLLFVFVREALAHPGEDHVQTGKRNPTTVRALRSQGYILADEDSLTAEAFLAYFETFEELQCPPAVQKWVDRFGISNLHWRRPTGTIKDQLPQERGKAYALLSTAFIGGKAAIPTWFHELGHLVFPRIDKEKVSRLSAAAKQRYPVVSSDDVPEALDPNTMRPVRLPKGTYLKLNGQFYGLDHSGPGVDAENDEIWAILFTEYCGGFEFPTNIRTMLEEIITSLAAPEPQQSS
ncbi:MAG TPA: hypothetical protein VN736_15145 [Candidatus Limnocylindrales bacterium]|nr:hypothetical protein [Candidatus Limnocylindrales bacterium]